MKQRLMVIIVTVFLGVCSSYAEDYVIGVEDLDYYPYYTSTGSDYQGFAREVLDLFAQNKGYTFIYKKKSVKRLFKSLINKQIDFKFPDNPYWSAKQKVGKDIVYSKPVTEYIDGVMVLPEKKGLGYMALKKLGTVMGFTAWEYLDKEQKGFVNIYENSDFEGLLKQTLIGRVDGAYINPVVANYHLDNTLKKPGALVFDPDLPHTKSNYLLSTSKHPDIIKAFDEFLTNNKKQIDDIKVRLKIVYKTQ